MVLDQDSLEFLFQPVDFIHALVLDPEVFHLDFNITYLGLELVLLLDVGDKNVEIILELLELVVDLLGNLVFTSVLEHAVFYRDINAADVFNNTLRGSLDILDLFEDRPDVFLLAAQLHDNLVDPLEVLVTIDIFGHVVPLSFHEGVDLLLVLYLSDRLLELFSKFLDLLVLILVLDPLIRDLLLLLEDFFVDGLFVLVPFFLKGLKLLVDLTNFGLENTKILSAEFVQLTEDFTLLLGSLLIGLQVVR